jgi:circadian clock protein KaiC
LIDQGAVEVIWQPPTEDLLDAYGERLLQAVQRRKVKKLFIDGLGAFRQASGIEPNRIGNFLTALMNEMRVLGVTTVYTLGREPGFAPLCGTRCTPPPFDLRSQSQGQSV